MPIGLAWHFIILCLNTQPVYNLVTKSCGMEYLCTIPVAIEFIWVTVVSWWCHLNDSMLDKMTQDCGQNVSGLDKMIQDCGWAAMQGRIYRFRVLGHSLGVGKGSSDTSKSPTRLPDACVVPKPSRSGPKSRNPMMGQKDSRIRSFPRIPPTNFRLTAKYLSFFSP